MLRIFRSVPIQSNQKLLFAQRDFSVKSTQPGDCIIVTGTVGDHGLAVLSAREGLGFEQRVLSDCASLQELILPLIEKFPGVHSMRDPTRGGLINVLHDIAEGSNVDLLMDAATIPIRREVKMGCEMLGINPFELVNEGKMILSVDKRDAEDVLNFLRQHPLGRESAIIAEAFPASGSGGRLFQKEGRLRKRLLRPEGNAVPRLC